MRECYCCYYYSPQPARVEHGFKSIADPAMVPMDVGAFFIVDFAKKVERRMMDFNKSKTTSLFFVSFSSC